MRLRIATLLPLGLFAAMGGALILGLNHDPHEMRSMHLGKPVPAFDLPALDPAQANVKSDQLKNVVTLVNIWGSWCASCRFEHPLLMTLRQDKRFTLIGIDWKDAKADAEKYLKDNGNPYAAIGTDASGRTAIDLGVTGAPETFLVDRAGKVRLRIPGPLTPEIWAKEIEPLLKDQEPAS